MTTDIETVEAITDEERKEIRALTFVSRHGDCFTTPTNIVAAYELALTERDRRIKLLEEVVDWYADFSNWRTRIHPDGSGNLTCNAYEDAGSKARAATIKE